jgi:divalent metal cation (Fe/Co/Zn/Cd) transporter
MQILPRARGDANAPAARVRSAATSPSRPSKMSDPHRVDVRDACCADEHPRADARSRLLVQARWLAALTVGWNVVEGVVATTAAAFAGSVALLGFGIDSFVESASGLVMIWRLGAELRHRLSGARLVAIERRAHRLIAASLVALAAFVTIDVVHTLATSQRPAFSAVGVAVTTISLLVMWWLARAKYRVANDLGSAAMRADAFQTTACWWLSLATLAGVGLNGLFGWWWADPVAALMISMLVLREAREAWRGEACC